jgi:hypothetical protein
METFIKSNYTFTRYWDSFNWELYVKIIKIKMKDDFIDKEYEQKILKNDSK